MRLYFIFESKCLESNFKFYQLKTEADLSLKKFVAGGLKRQTYMNPSYLITLCSEHDLFMTQPLCNDSYLITLCSKHDLFMT